MGTFRSLFETLVSIVLPKKARTVRTESLSIESLSVQSSTHTIDEISITTLLEYKDTNVEDVIRALKYDRSEHAARLCADILADYLEEEIAHLQRFSARPILIVPIPLHPARERERGFNQIKRVLDMLPKELQVFVAPAALIRTRDTKQQTRLPRRERLTNVEGAFRANESVRGAHIFLIDDVTTTGATLQAASRALTRAGGEVTALALARA